MNTTRIPRAHRISHGIDQQGRIAPGVYYTDRSKRFGTDPDDRPPMTQSDAFIAIAVIALSVIVVIALVAAVAYAAMELPRHARQAVAEEDARRAAAASLPSAVRAHHDRVDEALGQK